MFCITLDFILCGFKVRISPQPLYIISFHVELYRVLTEILEFSCTLFLRTCPHVELVVTPYFA
jgi:hypothetical protein